MHKKILVVLVLAAVGISMAYFLASYHRDRVDRVFDSSRVGNPDRYWLDFSYMDKSDSQTMYLESGDTLSVSYEMKDGRVNVLS